MSKKNDFVVFCSARTGSYMVTSLLSSAPDIICHGEIFKQKKIELSPWHQKRMAHWTIEDRNQKPLEFIAELRSTNVHRHVGFKCFNSHQAWAPELANHLQNPNVKKIILTRHPLEMYSSALKARATGKWVVRKDGPKQSAKTDTKKVKFTEESFSFFLKDYTSYINRCEKLSRRRGAEVFEYDKLHESDTRQRMLHLIGSQASADELEVETVKQWPVPVAERFVNWSTMMDYFKSANSELMAYSDGAFKDLDWNTL